MSEPPNALKGVKTLTCTKCKDSIQVEYSFPSYIQPRHWYRLDFDGYTTLELCPKCMKEFICWLNVDWLMKRYCDNG
jgi:hypothetical protein